MPGNLLHIDTDQVRTISNQLIQAQDEIEQNTQRVLSDVSSVEWVSPGRDSFIADVEALAQQVRQMTEQGRQLAQRLNQEAAEWENAAQTLNGLSSSVASIIQSGGGSIFWPAVQPALIPVLGIPLVLGSGLIAGLPGWVQDIFHKLLPYHPEPNYPQKQIPDGWTGQQPKTSPGTAEPYTPSGFGKLIEDSKKAETPGSTQPATPSASTAPAPEVTKTEPSSWYADVPTQNQHGLHYNGKDTLYGCTPTGASMVLDYWHQKDANNQTISAQDLLDKNVTEKEFNARGMSQDHLVDDLEPLGYKVETHWADYGKTDDQASALKEAVAKGPVLAVVRLNMDPNSKDIHTMVVTGISPEGKVRVNDPWDGTTKEYSWEAFDKVWGSNFGKDKNGSPYPTRVFTSIVPKEG